VISQPASAQLLVDPLEVTLATAGNARVSASFSMTNTTDNPVQATITRQDWDRDVNGDNRFLPAGTSGTSCDSTSHTARPFDSIRFWISGRFRRGGAPIVGGFDRSVALWATKATERTT